MSEKSREGKDRNMASQADLPAHGGEKDESKAAAESQDGQEDSPEGEEKKKKEKQGSPKDFFRVFKYASRLDALLFGLAFAGAIAVGATLPLMTIVFGSSTSSFTSFRPGSGDASAFEARVNHLVLYFVYLFVGRFVIGYLASLAICIAAARTTCNLRKAFLESLLRQEVSYFDRGDNGSPATQVTTNGNRVNQGIAEKLYTFVQGISLFFSAYIVALAVQWKLALIVMSIVPCIFGCIGGCFAFITPIEARITRIYSNAGTLAQDAISSIKTIHAFGAQDKIVHRYDEFLETAHKEGNKKSILYGIIFSTQTFFVMSGTSLAFWEGYRMYQSGEIGSVGTVFTVVLSVTLGATSVLLILPQMESLTNAASAASELFRVIDKESILDPLSDKGKKPETCTGHIEVRDLTFAYPSRLAAPVLQGLDLSIPAGKTTALVGPSGCGKSTLVGLLERWYQPTSGQIVLDGHSIEDLNTHWIRSNIRLVQQEPTLFSGTVFENVANGLVGEQLLLSDDDKMDLVKQACIASNAHDFIEKLPHGYYTELGERAGTLSGGQRQRISIARSIISDPKILLFDEATSALDPRAERVVQNALTKVSVNKTTLIIAHKLATVMAADNIAVMNNGKVIEQGTHTELVASDGLYAAMVRAQDLGAEGDEKDDESPEEHEEPEWRDDSDEKISPTLSLQRTQSKAKVEQAQKQTKELAKGTVGYSLIRCVWIMLREHPDLYIWYLVTVVGSTIGGGTYPAQAIIFSRLIRVFTLQGSEASSQADFWSLMFFVLAIANLFGYFCIGLACNTIGQTLTHRYRREMIERMIYFDQEFFDCPENTSGALTSKLNSVPSALQELFSANLGLILNVMVNLLSSSILGIAFGWKLGLTLVFGGLTLIAVSGYVRIRLDQKLEVATEEQFASSAGLATEAVGAIRTVSLLTLEGEILRKYGECLDGIVVQAAKSYVLTLVPYSLSQSLDFLVMALGFWYGSRLIAEGEYSQTQFFVIFLSVIFGGQASAQFFSYTSSITKGKVGGNYLLWLRTLRPTICETDDNRHKKPSDGQVSVGMDKVDFSYKQRASAKVLRGISLDIPAGTYAAFVGPSGCGKSTMISLLERFYDPTSGRIMMNGEDIASMSPYAYRRTMSLVQQEPPLYLGSVRENIALGLTEKPNEEEINEACRQANALEFISSLPEGLDTPCGSKGLQFSGGQRQRIAVARALIRKPQLLLLDEATSALDTQSERVVQKALDEAATTRTTVAVAHRLSTIKHADVIFVLEDGKIAEMGRHEELLSRGGRYHAMCLAQSLDQA